MKPPKQENVMWERLNSKLSGGLKVNMGQILAEIGRLSPEEQSILVIETTEKARKYEAQRKVAVAAAIVRVD